MTWSLYGPHSKPLSWEQLHRSVARGGSALVMMAAKELKGVLTEDTDLPSTAGVDSAERNQQARKAAKQKPYMCAAGDRRGDG